MADLSDAVLEAKYVEMIGLADFIVRDCGLPELDADGNPVARQNEIAAAIFRWAATQHKTANPAPGLSAVKTETPAAGKAPLDAS